MFYQHEIQVSQGIKDLYIKTMSWGAVYPGVLGCDLAHCSLLEALMTKPSHGDSFTPFKTRMTNW